jgi:preprotein translocase subunit YajC
MNPQFISLLFFAALFMAMIYFMMVRPMHTREKQHDRMVDELQKGDTVITAGGIFGVVEKINEDSIILKIESGAMMKVTKGGVIKRQEQLT